MPIYEYMCLECKERFEKLVRSMNSGYEVKCPKCGGRKVEKCISAFSTRMSSTTAASASACAPSSDPCLTSSPVQSCPSTSMS